MRPITDLRRRVEGRGEWLRLGLLSASVMAPLIARWNDLRAAEHAAGVRDEIEARVKALGELAPWAKQDGRQQPGSHARAAGSTPAIRNKRVIQLWLIGAGVGLAVAGVATYLLVRRRVSARAEEPYLDLPADVGNSARHSGMAAAKTHPAATPAAAGEPPRDDARTRQEAQTQPVEESSIVEPTAWDGSGAAVTPSCVAAEIVVPAEAQFVGDIHTMIYHGASAENLPVEQNRIYFASEEEARAAGYQRDKNEIPAGEGQPQG